MTGEIALKVGMAAGEFFTRGKHKHNVVIGKDTRLSGYLIEPSLTAGFISVGWDVNLLGPLPTPLLPIPALFGHVYHSRSSKLLHRDQMHCGQCENFCKCEQNKWGQILWHARADHCAVLTDQVFLFPAMLLPPVRPPVPVQGSTVRRHTGIGFGTEPRTIMLNPGVPPHKGASPAPRPVSPLAHRRRALEQLWSHDPFGIPRADGGAGARRVRSRWKPPADKITVAELRQTASLPALPSAGAMAQSGAWKKAKTNSKLVMTPVTVTWALPS